MSEETILGQALPSDSPENNEPENLDYLDTLVGDGKKYKDAQELAKAYLHADRRIRELSDEVGERQSTDSVLDEILATIRSQSDEPGGPGAEGRQEPQPSPQQPQVNTDDIEKIVTSKITQAEQERIANETRGKSLDLLAEIYGDRQKALFTLKKIIDNNPNMEQVIDRLGNTSPEDLKKLVLTYAPPEGNVSNTPGSDEGVSPAATVTALTGQVTWSEAQKIRKDDPKRYNSKEFRTVLERTAALYEARGQDFFAT